MAIQKELISSKYYFSSYNKYLYSNYNSIKELDNLTNEQIKNLTKEELKTKSENIINLYEDYFCKSRCKVL